jgi:hypothetical protein
MTLAAVNRRRPVTASPDAIEALLRELAEGQRRILAALERLHGPRDEADQAALLAIAETIGDRRWSSGQLLEHADLSPALHDALEAADVTNTRDLGWFCRRVHGSPSAGIRLERAGACRDGVLWSVVVSASQ